MGRKRKAVPLDASDHYAWNNSSALLCPVCSAPSVGFHYGVNSCDACKVFFHRALSASMTYTCKETDHCDVHHSKRNPCQSCRLKKCLEAGMTRSAIKRGRWSYARRRKDLVERKQLEQQSFIFTWLNRQPRMMEVADLHKSVLNSNRIRETNHHHHHHHHKSLMGRPNVLAEEASGRRRITENYCERTRGGRRVTLSDSSCDIIKVAGSVKQCCDHTGMTARCIRYLSNCATFRQLLQAHGFLDNIVIATMCIPSISIQTAPVSFHRIPETQARTAFQTWQQRAIVRKACACCRWQSPPSINSSVWSTRTFTGSDKDSSYTSACAYTDLSTSQPNPSCSGFISENHQPYLFGQYPSENHDYSMHPYENHDCGIPNQDSPPLPQQTFFPSPDSDSSAPENCFFTDRPESDAFDLVPHPELLRDLYSNRDEVVQGLLEAHDRFMEPLVIRVSRQEMEQIAAEHIESCGRRRKRGLDRTRLPDNTDSNIGPYGNDGPLSAQKMAGSVYETTREAVNFAKAIPGFMQLPAYERVNLIRYSKIEMAFLNAYFNTCPDLGVGCALDGHLICRMDTALYFGATKAATEVFNYHLRMCRAFQNFRFTPEEEVLLKAIIIMSSDKEVAWSPSPVVSVLYEELHACLIHEFRKTRPGNTMKLYTKLIGLLTEFRTYNSCVSCLTNSLNEERTRLGSIHIEEGAYAGSCCRQSVVEKASMSSEKNVEKAFRFVSSVQNTENPYRYGSNEQNKFVGRTCVDSNQGTIIPYPNSRRSVEEKSNTVSQENGERNYFGNGRDVEGTFIGDTSDTESTFLTGSYDVHRAYVESLSGVDRHYVENVNNTEITYMGKKQNRENMDILHNTERPFSDNENMTQVSFVDMVQNLRGTYTGNLRCVKTTPSSSEVDDRALFGAGANGDSSEDSRNFLSL